MPLKWVDMPKDDKKKSLLVKMMKVAFGFIGSGERCQEHISNVLGIQGNKIVAICDYEQGLDTEYLNTSLEFNVDAPKVSTGSELAPSCRCWR